ncbi:MAG: tetratricopeptide repeat protein [Betaproteobacteria bacterium]|nr:tetratricopeptide repeat protein [Betaproteobacteria bacterium]MDE2423776.1 tetratricopeptide repeat protein [Betaproteobacteria bacterium]
MYDHQEQEQIEDIKAWWKLYGKYVMLGFVVVIMGYAAFQGYNYYQKSENEKAGVLFEAVQNAFHAQDENVVLNKAKELQEAYASNPLASRAALMAAFLAHKTGHTEDAVNELIWVEAHTHEAMLVDLARLRHAGLLADQKKYNQALDLLNQNKDTAMLEATLDLKGDIYTVMGKTNDARVAYQQIIDQTGTQNSLFKQLARVKLDALGGSGK